MLKLMRFGKVALVASLFGLLQAQTAHGQQPGSDKEKLIGAWRLARIEAPGPDGKLAPVTPPAGMLIYTADGNMSVQLMYPKSANAQSNEYVQDGYEASFGSYDLNEATHTVTHHVLGSVTRERLTGQNLPRTYRFSDDGRLTIRSVRPDEHWSVTWEHYRSN